MRLAQQLPQGLPSECYELRQSRIRAQLTQEELSDDADVPARRLSLVERGRSQLSDEESGRVWAALVASVHSPRVSLAFLAKQVADSNCWSLEGCAELSGIPKGTWHRVVVRRASRPTPATREKLRSFVERYG
jgi:transcriptional regulator with XRE-family HTH domain